MEFNNCWFNDQKIDPDEYFERFSSFYFGDCLHFNSSRKNIFGDSVPIYNQSSTNLGLFVNFTNASIYIFVNDPLSIPIIDGFFYKRIDYSIEINRYFSLIISKTEENKLGLPYNPCYKDVNKFPMNKTIINFIQSNHVSYKQSICFKLCGELEYINTNPCNCTINTRLGSVWKNCYIIEKEQNLKDCSFKYFADHLEESAKKCKEYCPLECDSVSYSLAIEQNNENPGSSSFSIKYDELKYTLNSEIPKAEIFDFISNIGGILGLFI